MASEDAAFDFKGLLRGDALTESQTTLDLTNMAHQDATHADSDSDISMSTESDDEGAEADDQTAKDVSNSSTFVPGVTQPSSTSLAQTSNIPRKRKMSDALLETTKSKSNGLAESHKKLKEVASPSTLTPLVPKDWSLLPAEIWHRVLSYTPPRTLGLLLSVNKLFNAYLDPSSGTRFLALPKSSTPVLSQDAIWRSSRILHLPQVPHPLHGKSELYMWQLACGRSCQICGKQQSGEAVPVPNPWHAGPGNVSTASIWAFAVRTCGSCLRRKTVKVRTLALDA